MKNFSFSVIILLNICSCGNSPNKGYRSTESSSEETELSIDIQSIKSCADHGIHSFNMDSVINPEKYIDDSIIENILGKVPINQQKDWFLKVSEWERFSCFEWEENENHFLFTLLQQNEFCCLTMYLCASDKNGQIIGIQQLGLNGGDGGWFENDRGEKIGFGKFKLFYDSYYDEDTFQNGLDLGYTRENEYSELLLELKQENFTVDTLFYSKTDTLIRAE